MLDNSKNNISFSSNLINNMQSNKSIAKPNNDTNNLSPSKLKSIMKSPDKKNNNLYNQFVTNTNRKKGSILSIVSSNGKILDSNNKNKDSVKTRLSFKNNENQYTLINKDKEKSVKFLIRRNNTLTLEKVFIHLVTLNPSVEEFDVINNIYSDDFQTQSKAYFANNKKNTAYNNIPLTQPEKYVAVVSLFPEINNKLFMIDLSINYQIKLNLFKNTISTYSIILHKISKSNLIKTWINIIIDYSNRYNIKHNTELLTNRVKSIYSNTFNKRNSIMNNVNKYGITLLFEICNNLSSETIKYYRNNVNINKVTLDNGNTIELSEHSFSLLKLIIYDILIKNNSKDKEFVFMNLDIDINNLNKLVSIESLSSMIYLFKEDLKVFDNYMEKDKSEYEEELLNYKKFLKSYNIISKEIVLYKHINESFYIINNIKKDIDDNLNAINKEYNDLNIQYNSILSMYNENYNNISEIDTLINTIFKFFEDIQFNYNLIKNFE